MKRILFGLLHVKRHLQTFFYCLIVPLRYDATWVFYGRPKIYQRRGSSIHVGSHFIACSDCRHNSIGVNQPVVLKTCSPGAEIRIGNHVGISGCTVSAHRSVCIGNYVLIGSGALITDSDAHPIDQEARRQGEEGVSRPIVIEDDVFVGARAIILKGVRVGRGSVIGAGAVVTRDLPPSSVAAGNPARVIGRVK